MHLTSRLVRAAMALALLLPAAARADDHVRRTETGLAEHWRSAAVRVRFDPRLLSDPDASERAAMIAAAAWADVPRAPELVIDGPTTAPMPVPNDGENGIYLVEAWPFDPHLLAMTVSTVDPSTGEILGADVWVNAAHPLALLDEPGATHREYDLGALLSHELGHVLGLSENRDDRHATMWPTIPRNDTHQRTPDASDAASVDEAYVGLVPTVTGATYAQAACDSSGAGSGRGVHVAVILGAALAGWIAKRRAKGAVRVVVRR